MWNMKIIDECVLSDETRAYVAVFNLLNRDASPSTPEEVEEYRTIKAGARALVTRDLSSLEVCL
jgi:hypothetical protein